MELNPSEFMEFAPANPGEQTHVNHEGCSAGIDRKRRLYIKRLPDSTVLAYCHHCGLSGYYRNKTVNIYHSSKPPSAINSDPKDILLPKDVMVDMNLWPLVAKEWLIKYGITKEEVKKYGLVWSPSCDRLLVPLYMDGNYIGWQGRSFAPDKKVPRYYTRLDSTNINGNCGQYSSSLGKTSVVLVEDALSAIKCARYTNAIALLGSHPTPEVINWIANRYNDVAIWLDNDNDIVKKQQNKLASLFKVLVTGKVKLILTDKDPKDYSNQEILCQIT